MWKHIMDISTFIGFLYLVIGTLAFIIMIIFMVVSNIKKFFKQRMCKHEEVYTSVSHETICVNCGKKLGIVR